MVPPAQSTNEKLRVRKGWSRRFHVLKETSAEASRLQKKLGRKPGLARLWFTRSIRAHMVLAAWLAITALFAESALRELPIWLERTIAPLLAGGFAAGVVDSLHLLAPEPVIGASWLLGTLVWSLNLWLRLPRAGALAALGARGREIKGDRLVQSDPERALTLYRQALRLTPDPIVDDRIATKVDEIERQIPLESKVAVLSRAPTGDAIPAPSIVPTSSDGARDSDWFGDSDSARDPDWDRDPDRARAPALARDSAGDELPVPDTVPIGTEPTGADTLVTPMSAPIARAGGESVGPSNRYTLHRELGRGGMAVVFHATDEVLGREVALKQMHLRDTADKVMEDRFRLEARALASLVHPNIVQIFDLFEHEEELWIAMEYVTGGDLEDALDRLSRFTAIEAFEMLVPVARGLAAAHERGIVHRDVKPMNILIARDGTPKLTDFGIAKLKEASVHTVAESVMGSPHFMSPEQAAGQPAEISTDVYSLGITLYLLVTGRTPFEGGISQVMAQQITQPPPRPIAFNDTLDPGTEQLILDMLEKDPARRLPDMHQFVSRAEALLAELIAAES